MPATNLGAPIGTQDGFNRLFATSTPFAPGSVSVRVNGTTLLATAVSEVDSGGGLFSLATAPLFADVVVVAYQDPPVAEPGSLRGPAVAFVERVSDLSAQGGLDFFFVAGESGILIDSLVFDTDGNPFDLRGSTLYFEGKRDSEAGAVVFDKTSAGASPGIVISDQSQAATRGRLGVSFTSIETLAAAGTIVSWDLWIKKPDGTLKALTKGGGTITVRAGIRTVFP